MKFDVFHQVYPVYEERSTDLTDGPGLMSPPVLLEVAGQDSQSADIALFEPGGAFVVEPHIVFH